MYKRELNENGVKKWGNRKDATCECCGFPPDRSQWIRDWHQNNVPHNRYVTDLDFVKYRIDCGNVRFVGLLEFSSMLPGTDPTPAYLEDKKDQAIFLVMDKLARTLKVEAYYVLHTDYDLHADDKLRIFLYSIHKKGWPVQEITQEQLFELIHRMVVPRPKVWDWLPE